MKNLGKIFLGFILGLVAMFFIGRGMKHKTPEHVAKVAKAEEVKVVAAIKDHLNDTVTYYRDRYNQEHAQKVLVQGDAAAVRLFYKHKEDSLCRLLAIKPKQITGMYGLTGDVTGSFNALVDHIGLNTPDGPGEVRHFEYSDSLLQEEGWVDSANAYVTYSVSVPVSITAYWKRHWLLGRKHWFVDGYSENPHLHITGLTGVEIQ